MDSMMLEGPRLVEAHPGEEGETADAKLATLQQKWEALQQVAEKRLSFVFEAMALYFTCSGFAFTV